MVKKYRVLFHGLIANEDEFRDRMLHLGVASDVIEKLLKTNPIILKEDLPLGRARIYADAIQYAGGKVKLQEHGLLKEQEKGINTIRIKSLENFTMCPQCGYKQLKTDFCAKCGFALLCEKGCGKESMG